MRSFTLFAALLLAGCALPEPETAGPADFVQLTARGDQSCGLSRDGVAYCWGAADIGQAGLPGAQTALVLPTPIPFGPVRFRSVVAGGTYACGLTIGGGTICWGQGSAAPHAIEGAPAFERIVLGEVACGETSDHAIWCWPKVGGPAAEIAPAGVLHGVEAGSGACALDAANHAKCWGGIFPPTPTAIIDTIAWQHILPLTAWGCGQSVAGDVLCWTWSPTGTNGTPTKVTTAFILDGNAWVAINGTGAQLCLRSNGGRLYCKTQSGTIPVGEGSALDWGAFSPGDQHTCGFLDDGRAACWGVNGSGQVGDGTKTYRGDATLIGGGAP